MLWRLTNDVSSLICSSQGYIGTLYAYFWIDWDFPYFFVQGKWCPRGTWRMSFARRWWEIRKHMVCLLCRCTASSPTHRRKTGRGISNHLTFCPRDCADLQGSQLCVLASRSCQVSLVNMCEVLDKLKQGKNNVALIQESYAVNMVLEEPMLSCPYANLARKLCKTFLMRRG